MTTTTARADLSVIKARQQKTWASGDYRRRRLAHRAGQRAARRRGRPAAPAGRCWTSRAATATPPWRRPAPAPTPSASTTFPNCSKADAGGRWPKASTSSSGSVTPKTCPCRTRHSTRCFASSGRCSRRIISGPRTRSSGSPVRAAPSASPRGLPDGFIGEMFGVITRHVPGPPGVASPMLWGTEQHLSDLFGAGDRRCPVGGAHLHLAVHLRRGVRRVLPPLVRADPQGIRGTGDDGRAALAADLADLARRWDRNARREHRHPGQLPRNRPDPPLIHLGGPARITGHHHGRPGSSA